MSYDMSLLLITVRGNQSSVFNFGLLKVLIVLCQNLHYILRLLMVLGKGKDWYLNLKRLQLGV